MPSIKSRPTQQADLSFTALGTQWTIDSQVPIQDDTVLLINNELETYEKTYSRFRTDSLVAAMAKSAGTFVFPADFASLFQSYLDWYRLTSGAMNPLVGKALEQLGYDKDYSLLPGDTDKVPHLTDVLLWDGNATIKTTQSVVFDVGAAGKGQAVDRIVKILKDKSVGPFTVDASGDLYHHSDIPEVIGLEHPYDPTKIIGTVPIKNSALCASASNRRTWRGLHHIIDARTQRPVNDVVASWVIARDAMTADGLATALFFVDSADQLGDHFDFSYVRMFANGAVDYSDTFEGELFI